MAELGRRDKSGGRRVRALMRTSGGQGRSMRPGSGSDRTKDWRGRTKDSGDDDDGRRLEGTKRESGTCSALTARTLSPTSASGSLRSQTDRLHFADGCDGTNLFMSNAYRCITVYDYIRMVCMRLTPDTREKRGVSRLNL
jgi:hypothetical protein